MVVDMKDESKFNIQITVDTNDADYITCINEISKEDLDLIKPIIEAIKTKSEEMKNVWFHNYESGGFYDNDKFNPRKIYDFSNQIFDTFDEYLPFPETGFHTITSIKITPLITWTKLL